MTRLGVLLVLAAAGLPLTAQAKRFEVASIKPTRSTESMTVILQNTRGEIHR